MPNSAGECLFSPRLDTWILLTLCVTASVTLASLQTLSQNSHFVRQLVPSSLVSLRFRSNAAYKFRSHLHGSGWRQDAPQFSYEKILNALNDDIVDEIFHGDLQKHAISQGITPLSIRNVSAL